MTKNLKQILEADNEQKNIENMHLLEIGKITEKTLGPNGCDYETNRPLECLCVILKK